jgi:hypothetical protein
MTWKSHGAFNGIVLRTATHNLEWTLGGFALSHLPDVLECSILQHRGPPHVLSLWIAADAGALLFGNEIAEIATVAALLHLAAGSFSETGIPVWPVRPFRYELKTKANRLRLSLYKTGQTTEYLFLSATVGIAAVVCLLTNSFFNVHTK